MRTGITFFRFLCRAHARLPAWDAAPAAVRVVKTGFAEGFHNLKPAGTLPSLLVFSGGK
jgi:hypothetical protein